MDQVGRVAGDRRCLLSRQVALVELRADHPAVLNFEGDLSKCEVAGEVGRVEDDPLYQLVSLCHATILARFGGNRNAAGSLP